MNKYCILIGILICYCVKADAQNTWPSPGLSDKNSWSMVLLPDPQGYTKFARNQALLDVVFNWIVNNREKLNIRLVMCTGDLVEQNFITLPEKANGDQLSSAQWQAISRAFGKLDNKVPYALCTGNHDYGTNHTENRYSQFNSYFPPERNPLNKAMLVAMAPNALGVQTLENACYLFTPPTGPKMLLFALEYAPRKAVLQWAKALAARPEYAGCTGVVLTHSYMRSGVRNNARIGKEDYTPGFTDFSTGQQIWDSLVYPSANMQMVFCGHVIDTPTHQGHVGFRQDTNIAGLPVKQMLFNAQNEGGNWQGNGGNGWLRILEFLPDHRTVQVKTFSPLFGISPETVQMAWRRESFDEFEFSLHHKALDGATIQIDPTFPYYRNRSVESIADEIALAGYKAVHYFVVNEEEVNGPLIDAFHSKGIAVWGMVVGNGTYSTKGLPAGWEQWKMKLTAAPNGGDFTFFSLFNKDFVAWKKQALVKLVTQYPFDGVEMAETYFPEWDALHTGRYGDVGPAAQAAFREQYGLEMPGFTDTAAANYYRKTPALYEKWMQLRVNTVAGFQDEIYNGKGGVRAARPDILVATWSLALNAGPAAPERIREDHGLDAVTIARRVKPDVHFFQTHWPDWGKPETQLPADYMKHYEMFTAPLRAAYPTLPLGLQADQGSAYSMIKSSGWLQQLNREAPTYGYTTWTTYEYHLGGNIYQGAPVPLVAVQQGADMVVVSFSKRIDEASGANAANYRWGRKGPAIKKVMVDGNRAILVLAAPLHGENRLVIRGIADTPALRLYSNTPVNTMDRVVELNIAGIRP